MIVGLGIKRTGDWGSRFVHDLDTKAFLKKTQDLFDEEGLRLLNFTTYMEGTKLRWAGVYRSGDWGHRLIVDMSPANFVKTTQKLFDDEDLRLEAMNTYVVAGKEVWAGSYRSGDWGHRLKMDRTQKALVDEANASHKEGLRLIAARTYVRDGKQLWAAIYRSGDWASKLFLDRSRNDFFKDTQKAFDDDGLRVTDVTTYVKDGKRLFAGISRGGDWGSRIFSALNRQEFLATNQALFDESKLRLTGMVFYDDKVPTARLHLKTLVAPTIPIETMVANMRKVFSPIGIGVEIASREKLSLPDLEDLDTGIVKKNGKTTDTTTEEETELWSNRNNVATDEIPVYFVRTATGVNGEALFLDGPGCVVASYATTWTLAHEIGHLLGLPHCDNPAPPDPDAVPGLPDRLMTGRGTNTITNPPPDLVSTEAKKMRDSKLSITL